MAFLKELGFNPQDASDFQADPNWRSSLTGAIAGVLGRTPTEDEFNQVNALAVGTNFSGIYSGQTTQAAARVVRDATPTIAGWRAAGEAQAAETKKQKDIDDARKAAEVKATKGRQEIKDILSAALPTDVPPALRAALEQAITKQTDIGVSQATAEAARRGITGSSIESFGQATQRALGTQTLTQGLAGLLQNVRAEEERKRAGLVQSIASSAGISEVEANNLLNAALTTTRTPSFDPNALIQSLVLQQSRPTPRGVDIGSLILGGLETVGGILGAPFTGGQSLGLVPAGVGTIAGGLGSNVTPPPFIPGISFKKTPAAPAATGGFAAPTTPGETLFPHINI